jgi:hypothetical protein
MFEHITPHHPAAIMTFMQRLAECMAHAPEGTERERLFFACGFAHGSAQTVDMIEDAQAVAAGQDEHHAAQLAAVAELRAQAKAQGADVGDRVFVPNDDAKRTLRALVVDADAAAEKFAAQLKG